MTFITAIGTATPPYKRRQDEAVELVAAGLNLSNPEKKRLRALYKSTGIEYRYSVLSDYSRNPGEFEFFPNESETPFPSTAARMQIYKEQALPLSLQAIKECFQVANHLKPNEITHIITVSCTGMYAPGIDIELIQNLDLNSTVERTSIQFMGCYGAFNALKVADAICKANSEAKVLILSVELCTLHFQSNKSVEHLVSNAIFADGAAAVIVEASSCQSKYFSLEAFHCDLIPQTQKEMAWHIADSGFDIKLSTYVPEVIGSGIAEFIKKLIAKKQWMFSDIDLYAIHPGGIKILEECEHALNLTKEQNKYSYQVLRNYGNMSSATVLYVLKEIWHDVQLANQEKTTFSCAFGPGLTLESMLLKFTCHYEER